MRGTFVGFLQFAAIGILLVSSGMAQQASDRASAPADDSLGNSVRELQSEVRELRAAIAEIRSEAASYRAETANLRRELAPARTEPKPQEAAVVTDDKPGASSQTTASEDVAGTQIDRSKTDRTTRLEEDYQLLSGKIDEQYQTKVESASKYRMRLSGIVLLNLFSNVGTVENIDFPFLAYESPLGSSGGSFGATLRQSQIGFEIFGPSFAGARTRADLQLDLGGGFPRTSNGVDFGLMRLRTGTMRLDWSNTSVVAGQDGIFFSPNSPTSFATMAVPALSYTGNLWSWVPQVRVEHRISIGDDEHILLQGGILAPQSGEPPAYSYYRQPQAGELSRQPAYAFRAAFVRQLFGQPMHAGIAGYYSSQNYGFNRTVNAWAAMSDLDLPLGSRFDLSGKLYRGLGLGGLGGGIGRSVLFSGDPTLPTTAIRALNSAGGWLQAKYRASKTVEFNAAVGRDNPFSADLRAFPQSRAYGDPTVAKNQGSLVNVVFRPRSDLLFSVEYRHLKTYMIDRSVYNADHINLMMGVLF
jgi:hypothetical protein